jgi:hypothetical protein
MRRTTPRRANGLRASLAHGKSSPHHGIDGRVPANPCFGAQEALRKTLEAWLSSRELELARQQSSRKSVYLFGQIGAEQMLILGEPVS